MSNFVNELYNIRSKLETFVSKDDEFEKCCKFKFLRNIDMYSSDVHKTEKYFLSRNTLKVLKTIEKERLRQERKSKRKENN